MSKIVFSGVQPTGTLHLGNYLGAIKNWVRMQDDGQCLFCIVDLHAITVFQNPLELRKSVLKTLATYLACGIDPAKSTIFQQSMVSKHAELAWVLTCTAKTGWLNRMTQFKDKGNIEKFIDQQEGFAKSKWVDTDDEYVRHIITKYEELFDSIGAGLYSYPVLMAADILLYGTTDVPVGEDQLQHIQLARQIARAFNSAYKKDVFVIPEGRLTHGSRIMSLRYPDRKMSKSCETAEERIDLTDTPDQISKKIRRATTDTDMLPSEVAGLEGRLGAKNLLTILSATTDKTMEELCSVYGGKGFGGLKKDLADALVQHIVPIGTKLQELENDTVELKRSLVAGAIQADYQAKRMFDAVYETVGFN